jgi:hypothetical protein
VLTAVLLGGGAVAVLVRAGSYLADRLGRPFPLTPYVFPQYWLDYGDGFVRRALPGQVLRWLLGRPPDRGEAVLFATVLALAAVAGVLALAVALARRAGSLSAALAVAGAVVVSPVTLSLPVRDLGRPDSVGLAVLALLACVPWQRLPVPLATGLAAVLCATATATQEFLLLVVAPVAVLALARCVPGGRARVVAAVALVPAGVLALFSAVLAAPAAAVDRATAEAAAAGVPPAGALVPDHTSVLRLRYGFLDNLTAYYSLLDPMTVVATTVMWGGVAVLTLGLVWQLIGGALRDRRFVAVLAAVVLVAALLSCAGIDHRRWWALATVGGLAALVLLTPPSGAGEGPDRRRALLLVPAAALLVVAGWAMQLFPVFSLQV